MTVKSTMESVRKARMSQLLARCFDAGLGTIWQVREDYWLEHLPRYRSDRDWHPAVSLRAQPVQSLYELIPVLHGTSGDQGPVVMRGLTNEFPSEYPTSFGHLAPIPCAASEFVRKSLVPDVDPDDLPKMNPLAGRRICRNMHKPRCAPAEEKTLRKWAVGKGLLR